MSRDEPLATAYAVLLALAIGALVGATVFSYCLACSFTTPVGGDSGDMKYDVPVLLLLLLQVVMLSGVLCLAAALVLLIISRYG
jgi:hypothetical protein